MTVDGLHAPTGRVHQPDQRRSMRQCMALDECPLLQDCAVSGASPRGEVIRQQGDRPPTNVSAADDRVRGTTPSTRWPRRTRPHRSMSRFHETTPRRPAGRCAPEPGPGRQHVVARCRGVRRVPSPTHVGVRAHRTPDPTPARQQPAASSLSPSCLRHRPWSSSARPALLFLGCMDLHGFDLRVVEHGVGAHRPTEAAVLVTAERRANGGR
jgi:hypothetical protein